MSLDSTFLRSPQAALPVGVFGGTYLAAKAFLLHADDKDLQANNPYRRAGVSALAGGFAGMAAHPFAKIAGTAAKANIPNQPHYQATIAAFRAIQKPAIPNMIRNATRGFYPGFLAVGAAEGAREVYKRYQQNEKPA